MFSGSDRSVGSGRGALFGLRDEARLKQARTTGANELKTVCFEFRVDKFRLQGISARLGVLIACSRAPFRRDFLCAHLRVIRAKVQP